MLDTRSGGISGAGRHLQGVRNMCIPNPRTLDYQHATPGDVSGQYAVASEGRDPRSSVSGDGPHMAPQGEKKGVGALLMLKSKG